MSSRSGNVIYKKQFWLNEEQVKKLREKSISTNKKECELIRDMIMNYPIKEKPDKEFYDFLKLLRSISNNMNQIAAKAHSLGFVDELAYRKEVEKLSMFIIDLKKEYLNNSK